MNNQFKYYRKISFTQNELALKLHVTRQTISKWENGLSEPDINSMIQLSKAFNISFDQVASWYSIEEITSSPQTLKKNGNKKYDYLLLFIGVGNTIGIILLIILLLQSYLLKY